ncbi:LLM class flavin-dependent oxidoreductase [Georgenia sunbinii]|uniref:LLM class flavin-dependent oxidoreductase n=1 Tax=Georgenia sunbinii TaxID=3117728 RepID=UPI002F267F55
MTRIGAVFSPYHNAPEALRGAVEVAEAAGVPELWLWEDCFRESAYASVAAALAWTERLRIGLGISPIPLRNVAVTAMEIATIERMFPGRFYPGLGHGVLPWMAQAGVLAASPLTLMREYLPPLRSLLAGEEVTVAGRYVNLDKVRLDWPLQSPPPVYSAGVGPKTLALTGEVADGTVLVAGLSPAEVGEHARRVRDAHAAAGRDGDVVIVAYVHAAFGDGAQERVAAELGDSGTDDDRGVWGQPADVVAAVRRFAAAGADAVILSPVGGEPDLHAFLRAVGEVTRLVA